MNPFASQVLQLFRLQETVLRHGEQDENLLEKAIPRTSNFDPHIFGIKVQMLISTSASEVILSDTF